MASLLSAAPAPPFLRRQPPSAPPELRRTISAAQLCFQLPPSFPMLVRPLGLHAKSKKQAVFASNVDPPNQESGNNKAEASSSTVADAPPFATILAGLVVVFLIFRVIASIYVACWSISS